MIIDCPKKKRCKDVEEEECQDVPFKKCKSVKVNEFSKCYFYKVNSYINLFREITFDFFLLGL